jgi:hypothetical protein
VPHHALDHVPTQPLVIAHQLLERTGAAGEYGFDEGAIGFHPSRDTPKVGLVAMSFKQIFLNITATGRGPAVSLAANGHCGRRPLTGDRS